jgi:hypothetical protein
MEKSKRWSSKHRQALTKFYQENKVGRKQAERLAFWKQYSPGWGSGHKLTTLSWIRLHEHDYLSHMFPKDFHFC